MDIVTISGGIFSCNRKFLGISYYTKNDNKLCNLLTDIRCRFFTFRPVSSILYMNFYDRIIRSFASSPPAASSNFARRS